jgi:ATP-dependent DNA helicase PIF1
MDLSDSQWKAFQAFSSGQSIFITGDAGTGKSELIRRMVDYAAEHSFGIAVVAPTGIAAVNVSGRTIHSFLCLSPDDTSVPAATIIARMKGMHWYTKFRKNLSKLRCLIVDEISMVDTSMFLKMNELLQAYRSNVRPFGGLQVILVGDFFQLPPVYQDPGLPRFVFQLPLFYNFERFELTDIFRQQDEFASLLRRMRRGLLTERDYGILESRVGQDVSVKTEHGRIKPTRLFSKNVDVDDINMRELHDLFGIMVEYKTESQCTASTIKDIPLSKLKVAQDKFDKDKRIETLYLKPNAQVLLTYNLDISRGLCNGSRGIVVECRDTSVIVDFLTPDRQTITESIERIAVSRYDSEFDATFHAEVMPLRLAWATTIHKSQGLTLDCVEISLDGSVFAHGQAYVAVSRARSLESLSFKEFRKDVIRSSEDVRDFYSTPYSVLKLKYTS